MAIVLKDRVKETTTTTGTSSFTLAGAVGGFQSFAAVGNGNITYYAAVDPATGAWEVGKGTYSTTGPTLTRDTVYESSAAGAKVSFGAGPKDVFVTYPAERAIYEEPNGNTLIDGGPLTIVGQGVTGYTSFSAVLAEMYGNVDSFAQMYAQNLNDGSSASADLVAYNDLGDGVNNFVDVGINSSNYTSVDYPIFTPASAYLFNDGGEMFVGSATDDLVLFAGGVDTTDEAARIDKTTKALTTVANVNVGGALDVTSAATFGSTVLLDADPTLALQAATKQYVDQAAATGFTVHTPVRLVTTAALAANTYNNGTLGVGATLTANANGALSIDGVAVATSDRVLIKNEATAANNGVYSVTATGSAGTAYVLTRVTDFDTAGAGEIANNAYFFVTEGSTLAGSAFVLSQLATIIVGTTALPFTEFSDQLNYVGGTNIDVTGLTISLTGTVAATNGGTGTNTVTTGDLLYGSGTNTWGKLAAGAGYKSLVMNAAGTLPEWNAVALNQSGAVSGTLPATNGGTGQSAYAVGDTLYSGTTNTLDKLSGNTTTTKKFLGQTGTGSASQAPVWEQPAASDITGLAPSATTDTTNAINITSGTLPALRLAGSYTGVTGVGTLSVGTWNANTIAANRGGTGQSSYAVGDLVYADTTTTLAKLPDVATGNALISGGVGTAPAWGKIGLATHVSGTLPVANGGTNGSAVPTAGALAFGTGTAYNFTAAGTSGQLLTSAGAGTPTWTTPSSLSVATATNVAGGAANQVLYQSGAGATTFTTAPTTAGTALTWNGSAFVWQTAGSATIQNDTSTNDTYYPTFATATSGAFTDARVSSTKLTFNPNTGRLTTTALTTSGLTMNGTLLFSNATSPNSYTVQFGDNTGWNLRFMTSVSGTPTTRFTFGDNGNFTSVGTVAGSAITATGIVSGTSALFSNQGRFSGWYTSGSGLAAEIGVSGTDAYILSYNRSTSAYSSLEIDALNIRLVPQGGTLTGPGGNVILHAGNVSSYALPIGGGTLTTGANSNLFIGRNSVATAYNAISLNGSSGDSSNMGLTGGGGGDTTLYVNAPGEVRIRTNSFGQNFYFNGSGFTNPNRQYANNGIQISGAFILAGSGATYDNSIGVRLSENYGPYWNLGNGSTWHYQIVNGSLLVGISAGGTNYGSGNIRASGEIYANTSNLVLNAGNYTNYAIARGGDTLSGIIQFQSNLGATSGNLANAALQAYSTGNNSAFLSFHKGGYYAINMGLDSDNVLRIGGWSAPANRWQLDVSGNQTVAGSMAIGGGFTIDTPGSGYGRFNNWVKIGTTGFFSDTNSAHIYPNNVTYGSWRVDGSRNGWSGIHFGTSNVTLMMNSNESGHHRESYGWQFRWNNGTLYCSKNSNGGGAEGVVFDTVNSASSNSGNGYQRLATGIIIQWGTVSYTAARFTGISISFPIAFSSVYSITTAPRAVVDEALGYIITSSYQYLTTTSVTLYGTNFANAAGSNGVSWIAIGT